MTPKREAELRPNAYSHVNPGKLVVDLEEALAAVARQRKEIQRLKRASCPECDYRAPEPKTRTPCSFHKGFKEVCGCP